ncbi:MAG TPA: fibronectin type III domain-containing protein, partial [Chitinophagaceae bacterium]
GYDSYMDSIVIRETPICNPPTALVVSNITNNAAQLDFTAPASGSPVNYEVYYSTSNVAPGSSTVPQVTGVTGTTANLSGLTASTKYYVWVRSYCGGTDRSDWSVGTNFTTACDTASLPLNQGFNATTLPVCWSTSIVTGQSSSAISFLASSSNLTAAPQEGTHFVRYNSYSTSSGGEERLISPEMSSAGVPNLDVRFQWFQDGSSTYSTGAYLNEGVTVEWSADGTNWTTVQYFPRHVDGAPATGEWSAKSVNIPAAGNLTSFWVAFRFHSSYGYNMYLDNVSVLASVSLPVTISSFTGKLNGEANLLTWTTSTETNNRGFELQRSADGSSFSTIGFVASKGDNGNSNNTLSYAFADSKPISSSYYRLKQVDNDGKFRYSNTVLLARKFSEISLSSVFPNPAGERLNLVIASPKAAKVIVVITDLSGRVLMQSPVQLAEGSNKTTISLTGLASGSYLLKLVCADGCESSIIRFVRQ